MRDTHTIALFDVEEKTVGLAFLSLAEHPTLLWSARTRFSVDAPRKSMDHLLHEADLRGIAKPSRTIVTLEPPLYHAETRFVHKTVSEPKPLTKALFAEFTASLPELAHEDEDTFEKQLLSVRLNGYLFTDYHNRVAREVDISLYEAVAPKNLVAAIGPGVILRSASFTTAEVLRGILKGKESFLFLDVGDGETTVSLVEHGSLIWTTQILFGTRSALTVLAHAYGTIPEETESALRSYQKKTLDPERLAQLEQAMAEAETGWVDALRKVLDERIGHMRLPEELYIVGDERLLPFFAKAVNAQDTAHYTYTNVPITVVSVTSPMLASFCKSSIGVAQVDGGETRFLMQAAYELQTRKQNA